MGARDQIRRIPDGGAHRSGKVHLLTRSGLDWTAKNPATAAALAKHPAKPDQRHPLARWRVRVPRQQPIEVFRPSRGRVSPISRRRPPRVHTQAARLRTGSDQHGSKIVRIRDQRDDRGCERHYDTEANFVSGVCYSALQFDPQSGSIIWTPIHSQHARRDFRPNSQAFVRHGLGRRRLAVVPVPAKARAGEGRQTPVPAAISNQPCARSL